MSFLGFDNLADYRKFKNQYFSALIGRYANRIAIGQFVLDGKAYRIPANSFRLDAFAAALKALIRRFGEPRRSAIHTGSEWS